MVVRPRRIAEQSQLSGEIKALLPRLGEGQVESLAYETAWVARLAPRFPQYSFADALAWLRQNQHDDGTWGTVMKHAHDRFLSTLAAIVALKEVDTEPRAERRIKRGEEALWKVVGQLRMDDNDTVGFPILSAALAEEATELGLEVPRPPIRHAEKYQKKVNAFLNLPNRNWRSSPITFSLEGLRDVIQRIDPAEVLEANGSVSISPSATAALLRYHPHSGALNYLAAAQHGQPDGGLPVFMPLDVYETAWAINHLRMAGAVSPDEPEVRRALDLIWSAWSNTNGVSSSSYSSARDLDDTAAAFSVLNWGGYPVDPNVFKYYELTDHFCCYPNETDPSISVQVRLLLALRSGVEHPRLGEWVQKIVQMLRRADDNGCYWSDKWHISPYYVNSFAIYALHGIDDELANTRLTWILRTRNDDGGWGHFGESTAEETAYCLEALCYWDQNVEAIDPAILEAAARYLYEGLHERHYGAMWIAKTVYAPNYIVRAAILAALYRYESRASQ